MEPDATTAAPAGRPPTVLQRTRRWWRENWNHPAMSVVYLVVATQAVKEYYPLSEFAMYSNPTAEPTRYLFLVDADRFDQDGALEPVAMEHSTGYRAAKAKKIFNSRLGDAAGAAGVKKEELDDAATRETGEWLLAFLRERAASSGRGAKLPARIALVEGRIEITPGGLEESQTVIASEP